MTKDFLEVEPSATDTITFPDGREFMDVDMVVSDDVMTGLLNGRICCQCFEPQSEAWPEVCEFSPPGRTDIKLCGFRIRDEQPKWLAWKHKDGVAHIGSRINREDELERMREHAAYEERTGVVLPDHVKFPTTVSRPS